MIKYLTIWFILCTWIALPIEHAHAQEKSKGTFVRDALIFSIVISYAVDALQDGIAFTKSPKGQDLRHLWHGAKYAHVVGIFAVGALNVISIRKYGWKKTLLFDAVGFVVGVVIWRYTYPVWRKVNWPDWAYMIDGGKQRWHGCEFPHSWDKNIEHIINTKQVKVFYG